MTDPVILPRSAWGARRPRDTPTAVHPRDRRGLTVHHNGAAGSELWIDMTRPDNEIAAAEQRILRGVQNWHMDRMGWPDFAYSYAVAQSGRVYEGRGLWWRQFANGSDVVGPDDGPDSAWYTVLWLGGGTQVPTLAAYVSLASLVDWLRRSGAGMRVLPHNAFKKKECPGRQLTDWCKQVDNRPIGDEDVMTPEQAQQLRQVWEAVFGAVGGGPIGERLREIHEGIRPVQVANPAAPSFALSDADVARIATQVVDLMHQRLKA